VIRNSKCASLLISFAVSLVSWAVAATAAPETTDPQPSQSQTAPEPVSIQLNKLEPIDKGCRAYMVIDNPGDTAYSDYKIDLVLFQSDGVIGKRFSIDLAPLKAKKKSVKLFDIDGLQCDKIGSMLINDVMECKSDTGSLGSCLQNLKTSTLTNVQLSK
jgi:hypothetical protein